MAAGALLLRGARAGRLLIACACTAVLVAATALASIDEVGGFSPRPVIYTAAKWDFAIALGVIFAVIGAAVVVTGIHCQHAGLKLHPPGSTDAAA